MPQTSIRTALLTLLAAAEAFGACAQQPVAGSFYEFGTVVAIGQRTVDIQAYDQARQRLVQHSFALSRESRADIVHIGDPVEVVFSLAGGEWSLRRMIVLAGGIPIAGPPPGSAAPRIPATGGENANTVSAPALPAATVPSPAPTHLPAADTRPARKRTRASKLAPAAPVTAAAVKAAPSAPTPTSLASSAQPKPTVVIPVALGSPAETRARAAAGKTKDITISRPAEECNRSSADWPQQPLRIAVLDFRYPTEREESHDIGTTGGGSGTAVADLVFARLEDDEQNDDRFLFSRADRRRLDRSDFAGAARLGRQLGVDAVLAGTFVPVDQPLDANGFPMGPKTFELRSGIVDTCTGQLLLQSSSVTCAGAISPGITAGADPKSCTRIAIKAAETANPKAYQQDFKPALDAMLYPLEHQAASHSGAAPAGTVSRVTGDRVSVQLPPHSQARPGDQLTLRASRLAKNPSTYTLHNLQNEEIGRVSIQTIAGNSATGIYTGDFAPHPGDTAEITSP